MAITIAQMRTPIVVASDISPAAAAVCRKNAQLNGAGSVVKPVVADAFSAFSKDKFDLIVCNAPALPSKNDQLAPQFLRAGPHGRTMIDLILDEFSSYLATNGRLLLAHSSLADVPRTIRILRDRNVQHQVIAEEEIPFRSDYYPHLSYLKELRRRGQADFGGINERLHTTVSILEIR